MVLWCLLISLVYGAPSAASAAPTQKGGIEWVFIDGAKEPWLLPEWLVWQNVLAGIYTIRSHHLEGSPFDSLPVTAAERKRIESAATWYNQHQDACTERQKREVEMLRAAKRPQADLDDGQRKVILDCREQVLDRVDRFLGELSGEGRAALLAYVNARKSGMWMRVAKSELDFYKRPR